MVLTESLGEAKSPKRNWQRSQRERASERADLNNEIFLLEEPYMILRDSEGSCVVITEYVLHLWDQNNVIDGQCSDKLIYP